MKAKTITVKLQVSAELREELYRLDVSFDDIVREVVARGTRNMWFPLLSSMNVKSVSPGKDSP